MMNVKATLKKLHKKFPMMSLDELFEILDCFVEDSLTLSTGQNISTTPWNGSKIWYDNKIQTFQNTTATTDNCHLN